MLPILKGDQTVAAIETTEPERVRKGRQIRDLCSTITRAVNKRAHAKMAALDLSMGAYNLLHAIGDRSDMTIAEASKILRVESATLSTLVVRMERDGFLSREPSPSDKRAALLKPTEHAVRILGQADQIMALEAADLTHRLSNADQAQIIVLLERVLANLDDSAP